MSLRVQAQESNYAIGITFSMGKGSPTMHSYQNVENTPNTNPWYRQKDFSLLLETGVFIQVVMDDSLKSLYPVFQRRDALPQIIIYCFMGFDMILSRTQPVLLPAEHILQVIKPIQKMLQLFHLPWQWLPDRWIPDKTIMSQSSGVLGVVLDSLTYGFSPSFGMCRIGETTNPSILLVHKMGKGLLISTRRLHSHMNQFSTDGFLEFLYHSLYAVETCMSVGILTKEYSFLLLVIPVGYVQGFLTNVNTNTQFLHQTVSLFLVWGFLTTWYADSLSQILFVFPGFWVFLHTSSMTPRAAVNDLLETISLCDVGVSFATKGKVLFP
jgi:hypothetical protein